MGSVFDSGIFIAAERGQYDLDELLDEIGHEPVVISVLTASELLSGVHRATDAVSRAARQAFVDHVLLDYHALPFDLGVARVHARLGAELMAKGTPVGAIDLQIGATAVRHGYQVVTRDKRSFPKIPGLQTVLV